MTKPVFQHLSQLQKKIIKSNQILLFLDYDGTLVCFQNRPEEVHTPEKVKKILTELTHMSKITVVIISGRTLQELKMLLPLPGLHYAAVHGLVIDLANGELRYWDKAKDVRSLLENIQHQIKSNLKMQKGLVIEDKEISLAFHYRLIPEAETDNTIATIINIAKQLDKTNSLNIIHGEKVIELRPKGWHKGNAVEYLLSTLVSSKHVLPIYIGDDTTDEDAFKQLNDKGITIYVKNHEKKATSASYYLSSHKEVISFLEAMVNVISKQSEKQHTVS